MFTTQSLVNRKAADQAITSSTTLTDITGLSIDVMANTVIGFRAFIPFALAGVVSGYKVSVNGPASPSNLIVNLVVQNAVAGTVLSLSVITSLQSTLAGALATTGTHHCIMEGCLENGANAGTFVIQGAQNTSDAGAITFKRGGWITAWLL